MLRRFGLFLNTVVRIRRKETVILQNTPHRMPKWLSKIRTIFFNPKFENIWQMCICTFWNWNQEVNSYQLRKITPEIDLTLKNPFFIKSTKNVRFLLKSRMLNTHLHYPEVKARAFIQPETEEKQLCMPYTARKKNIYFYQ